MHLTSFFGVGLLVGAAFFIIVPEAMTVIVSAEIRDTFTPDDKDLVSANWLVKNNFYDAEHLHQVIGLSITAGFVFMLFMDKFSEVFLLWKCERERLKQETLDEEKRKRDNLDQDIKENEYNIDVAQDMHRGAINIENLED